MPSDSSCILNEPRSKELHFWYTSESGARTRTHSQSYRENKRRVELILHEVLLECDASSHRFWRPSLAHAERVMIATVMRESWPHAPPHYFTPHGTYIITAATLHRKRLFHSAAKLDLLRDTTLELAENYALTLQAWAFFPNHYHLVVGFENSATTHRDFMGQLHRELAIRLNRMDRTPARRVMYEFWDTHLTFEKSWLARLNYVHQNAVKHRLVAVASQYPWCSAPWFETNARPGFVKSVYSFKTDEINVPDDF